MTDARKLAKIISDRLKKESPKITIGYPTLDQGGNVHIGGQTASWVGVTDGDQGIIIEDKQGNKAGFTPSSIMLPATEQKRAIARQKQTKKKQEATIKVLSYLIEDNQAKFYVSGDAPARQIDTLENIEEIHWGNITSLGVEKNQWIVAYSYYNPLTPIVIPEAFWLGGLEYLTDEEGVYDQDSYEIQIKTPSQVWVHDESSVGKILRHLKPSGYGIVGKINTEAFIDCNSGFGVDTQFNTQTTLYNPWLNGAEMGFPSLEEGGALDIISPTTYYASSDLASDPNKYEILATYIPLVNETTLPALGDIYESTFNYDAIAIAAVQNWANEFGHGDFLGAIAAPTLSGFAITAYPATIHFINWYPNAGFPDGQQPTPDWYWVRAQSSDTAQYLHWSNYSISGQEITSSWYNYEFLSYYGHPTHEVKTQFVTGFTPKQISNIYQLEGSYGRFTLTYSASLRLNGYHNLSSSYDVIVSHGINQIDLVQIDKAVVYPNTIELSWANTQTDVTLNCFNGLNYSGSRRTLNTGDREMFLGKIKQEGDHCFLLNNLTPLETEYNWVKGTEKIDDFGFADYNLYFKYRINLPSIYLADDQGNAIIRWTKQELVYVAGLGIPQTTLRYKYWNGESLTEISNLPLEDEYFLQLRQGKIWAIPTTIANGLTEVEEWNIGNPCTLKKLHKVKVKKIPDGQIILSASFSQP